MKVKIVPGVFALCLGVWAALPEGYTQLEWIESTGCQYIDTGIVATDAHGFLADYYSPVDPYSGNQILCGSRADAGDTRLMIGSNFNRRMYVGWNGLVVENTRNIKDTFRDVMAVNYLNSRKVTGRGTTVAITQELTAQDVNFYVFAGNMAYNNGQRLFGEYRLYSFKMSEGSSCIRDYIPARRDADGKLGLYDRVHSTFAPNLGTGIDFLPGPAVDGMQPCYEELEYLDSSGTEYIDTGVTFTDRHGFEIVYQARSDAANANVCGSRSSNGDTRCVVGQNRQKTYVGWNTLVIPSSMAISESSKGTVRVNYLNSRQVDCRGTVVSDIGTLAVQKGTFYLFAGHYPYATPSYTGGAAYRIYSFKMTEGREVIMDVVPARRRPDGALGMYDRKTKTFFEKQGTGAFTGNEPRTKVLPDGYVELPYLESTGTQYINTGVKCAGDVHIDATVYNPLYASKHIVGARRAFQQDALGLSFQVETGALGFRAAYGSQVRSSLGLAQGAYHVFSFGNDTRVLRDARPLFHNFDLADFSTDLDIYAFSVNDNGKPHSQSSAVRISALQIWQGHDLVRDYVPALSTNTFELGLYDRQNGVFHTNAGTGTFLAGAYGAGFGQSDLIANGDFENGTAVSAVGDDPDSGYAALSAAGTTDWTGDGYITRASNAWVRTYNMLNGKFAAVLPQQASILQTVVVETSGRYRLVFEYQGADSGINTLVAKIDGSEVARVTPSHAYGFLTFNGEVMLRAGSHVLSFVGEGKGATCLDSVSLQLVQKIPAGTMVLFR